MATLDTVATREAGTDFPAGKAYFETSTNKFIVWNGSQWIELHSDGAGAIGYTLDATRELSAASAPVVHLDASELSLSDGASVTSWTDKTSNGNNIPAVGTPLYYNNVYGGKAAVQIDLGDGFTDTSFFTNNDFSGKEATLFMVYIPTSSTGGDTSVYKDRTTFFGARNGNDDLDSWTSGGFPGTFLSSRTSVSDYGSNDIYSANVPSAGIRIDSTVVSETEDIFQVSVDGGVRFSLSPSTANKTFYADVFSLGNTVVTGGFAAYAGQGYVFEVLLFNKKLTEEEQATVGSYLATKYSANYSISGSYNTSYSLDSSFSTSVSPALHIDANSTDTVLSGTSVAVNGDPVSAWVFKNSVDRFTMNTASSQPTFVENRTPAGATNTSNALYFDGTQYLDLPNPFYKYRYSENSGNSLFIIMEPDNRTHWAPVSDELGQDYFRFGNSSYPSLFLSSAVQNAPHNGAFGTSGIHLLGIYNNTSTTNYVIDENGTNVITSSGIATKSEPAVFRLGWSYYGGGFLVGWLYEILYFPGELSSADKTALLNYAKNKYGVS